MSEERTNALLELYKANMQFFEQVTALAQQAGQQWQDESQRAIATAIAEPEVEFKELLDAKDFLALLASQTDIVQRCREKHHGAVQAALLASTGSAGTVVTKLAEAFGNWQRRVGEVAGSAGAVAGVWSSYPNPFLQFWTSAVERSSAKRGRGEK